MEGYNPTEGGTTSSFCNLDKIEHNVLDVVLEDRRLEDREPADIALLTLNRPLGSREWFAVNATIYLSPRVGPERVEKIVAAASEAFDDEEHDERMLAVRYSLREPVVADAATDADLAAEFEQLAPGVPGLLSRWCARSRREQGGAR